MILCSDGMSTVPLNGARTGMQASGIMWRMRSYAPKISKVNIEKSKANEKQNFSAGSVAFWHSTGADPLTQTVAAVSVSASSNGADWHLGVLELPVSGQADKTEDFYFSGVYIESGSLTKTVAGPTAGSSRVRRGIA